MNRDLCKHISVLCLCIGFSLSAPLPASTIISQQDVRKYNLGLGKTVFLSRCVKCHDNPESENSAPQIDNPDDWRERIDHPVERLITHALNGCKEVSQKGDSDHLSDRQVSAAVAYALDRGRRLLISEGVVVNQPSQLGCTGRAQGIGIGACRQKGLGEGRLIQLMLLIDPRQRSLSIMSHRNLSR